MAFSFVTLSTKETSITNETLATKTVHTLIDEEVDLTKNGHQHWKLRFQLIKHYLKM